MVLDFTPLDFKSIEWYLYGIGLNQRFHACVNKIYALVFLK